MTPDNTSNMPAGAEPADFNADVDAHAPPSARRVVLSGQTFELLPMSVQQLFPFLKLARPIFAALTRAPSSPRPDLPPTEAGAGQGGEPNPAGMPSKAQVEAAMGDADSMLNMLETHGPSFVSALAIGIGEEGTDRIGRLTVVDLIVLARHFVEVNVDFFVARGLSLPQNLLSPNPASAAASDPAIAAAPPPKTP